VHKNVKVFISHGGISGLYEAVDARVPVLGFILFGDQYRNIDNLVEAGMGISMEMNAVTLFFNSLFHFLKYLFNTNIRPTCLILTCHKFYYSSRLQMH